VRDELKKNPKLYDEIEAKIIELSRKNRPAADESKVAEPALA
jgi:hypothetical protein